jgi:hypothetical protein
MNLGQRITMGRVVGETVKPGRFRVRQIRDNLVRMLCKSTASAGLDRRILLQNQRFWRRPLALPLPQA